LKLYYPPQKFKCASALFCESRDSYGTLRQLISNAAEMWDRCPGRRFGGLPAECRRKTIDTERSLRIELQAFTILQIF
jgi:hypothetical protein